MKVVVHDGESKAIDREYAREELHAPPNPLPAIFVVLARNFVDAAKEGPPHTAMDAVQNLHLCRVDDFIASLACHGEETCASVQLLSLRAV